MILFCFWSQSFRHDWRSDMLCNNGATAGLWFPDLVRLMLQKGTEVRLHSTAWQHAAQLSPWCTHPTQYCCDTDGTCDLSYRRETSSIAAPQNAPIGCCLLSSVCALWVLHLTHTWSRIQICSTKCLCLFSAEQDVGKKEKRARKKTKKREKNVVNVTEPWKAWPGVGMTLYTRFFSAVAAGINITYISPSHVQEISSPGTYNLNTLTVLWYTHKHTHAHTAHIVNLTLSSSSCALTHKH